LASSSHCSPLNSVELVINKVFALASCGEPYDIVDILFVHSNVSPHVRE
jgi:hypothetical protein